MFDVYVYYLDVEVFVCGGVGLFVYFVGDVFVFVGD